MSSNYQTHAQSPQWKAVSELLLSMLRQLEAGDSRAVNLLQLAESYAALAHAYVDAITAEGRSSMRAEAAAKALDLRTAKSQLLSFLDRRADSESEPVDQAHL